MGYSPPTPTPTPPLTQVASARAARDIDAQEASSRAESVSQSSAALLACSVAELGALHTQLAATRDELATAHSARELLLWAVCMLRMCCIGECVWVMVWFD